MSLGNGLQLRSKKDVSFESSSSMSLDGSDDVLISSIPVLGDTHTISAWFKTTAGTGGFGSEATIVSYISKAGGGDDSVLSVANNKLAWSDFVDDGRGRSDLACDRAIMFADRRLTHL